MQNNGSSDSSKKFSKNRKMSINNYTNFNTNKQTSFRQSYVGVSASNTNIGYNNYNNIHNYSSLTNSSGKPGNTSGSKRAVSQKSKNFLTNENADGTSNPITEHTLDDKIRDLERFDPNERQRSIDSRHPFSRPTEIDVEMEDDAALLIKGSNNLQDLHQNNKSCEDMEIDDFPKDLSNDDIKSHLTYEANNKHKTEMTDQQKLDYFHNVIMKE